MESNFLTREHGKSSVPPSRKKFVTQVNAELISALRNLAQSEGPQLHALVEEAFANLIEKRKQGKPRAHVVSTYQASHETFGTLYKKLAD